MSPKGKNRSISISKGDLLECVLSKRDGGKIEVPDLSCQQFGAGKFYLSGLKLKINVENRNGEIDDLESAYIVSQNPRAGDKTNMSSSINVTIQQAKPMNCQ